VGEQFAHEHLQRLEDRYYELFAPAEVAEHLQAVASLSPERPVELLVRSGREIECTVIGFDYPGEFSVITGILGSTGFNILSGSVFTYRQPPCRPVCCAGARSSTTWSAGWRVPSRWSSGRSACGGCSWKRCCSWKRAAPRG
jgi:hypothetical protein